MGTGGALPVRAEVVHQSERTRVTRLFLPGGTIIRKEPLGPSAERRARHEMAVLERLRGVAGAAQLAEAPQYQGSVVLADAGRGDRTLCQITSKPYGDTGAIELDQSAFASGSLRVTS